LDNVQKNVEGKKKLPIFNSQDSLSTNSQKKKKKSENNVQHLPDFPPSNTNINKQINK
jgi:hypothetical protein